MKLLMIWGGLIGFGAGALAGLAQGCAWPDLFWRACVAALLAGVALRWWGWVWASSLQAAQRERERAAHASPTSAADSGQA